MEKQLVKKSNEILPLKQLVETEGNPQSMTKEDFEGLKRSMKTKGWILDDPVVWKRPDGIYQIISGHHRVQAAIGIGILEHNCKVIEGITEEQALLFVLEANQRKGSFDDDILNDFLNNLTEEYDIGIDDIITEVGFTDNSVLPVENITTDGWNPEKYDGVENGDGINELCGYGLQSFWKDIKNTNCKVFDLQIKLPVQPEQNLVRQRYSRTNLEEIQRIVKTYMREGDYFLESCCGWSTFGSVAKFFGYNGVGVDIWDKAIEHSIKQLNLIKNNSEVKIIKMDAMDLSFDSDSFDYIYCNPPFMDMEKYSGLYNDIADKDIESFFNKLIKLMKENIRVLKAGCLCTITINDKRENSYLIPIQKHVIDAGIEAGFKLWDFVIAEVNSQKIRLRKKDYELRRTVKCHEYIITFKKQ